MSNVIQSEVTVAITKRFIPPIPQKFAKRDTILYVFLELHLQ